MRAALVLALGCALLARVALALQVVATLEDVAAIERSAGLHALILVAEKPREDAQKGQEDAPEELADEQFAAMAAAAYPALQALEEELAGLVTFSIADLSPHRAAKFAGKWSVPALPALVLYTDPPKENPYTGSSYREALVGDIMLLDNARKFKKVIKESVPTEFVHKLPSGATAAAVDAFVDKRSKGEAVVLLVSKQKDPSHLFHGLANEFHHRKLSFAFVQVDDDSEIAAHLKLEKVPSLVVIKSKSERYVQDDSSMMRKFADLKSFVEPFAGEKTDDASPNAASGASKGSMMRSIVFLTEADFETEVIKSDVVWVVAFVTPEEEAVLDKKVWTKTFAELQKKAGIVGIAAVSCERDGALCEKYGTGIRVFPLTLNDHSRPKRGEVLEEVFPTLEAVKEVAVASIPDVTTPIGSNIELQAFVSRAMAEHTMPVLFFTSKTETPALIKSMAMSFPTQKMEVAVLRDADIQLKTQFTIRPTESASLLCLVPPVGEVEKIDNTEPFGVAKYDKKIAGPYNYPNVMRFLMNVLSEYPHPRDDLDIDDIDADDVVTSNAASSTSVLPYVNKETMESLCSGNKICAIGFFEEHIETLNDPESPLTKSWTVLARAATLSKQNREPYHFMWVNGKCQAEFAEAFGVGHYQMPTVVVYSPAKQRFATNVGLFNEDNVGQFLKGVLSGRIGTAPLGSVPQLKDECSLEDLLKDSVDAAIVDTEEDDESLDDLLSEIITEEQKHRELLEEAEKESKKPKKKKSKKKSKKSKKGERDEL